MSEIERSPEKRVRYIGRHVPPGYGRLGVAWREREIRNGIAYTDPPGYFYFRPDDNPQMICFVHRDDLEPIGDTMIAE
jgi:hypothetical protein